MLYSQNTTGVNIGSNVMYIDMNSFFAGCEQQRHPELRHKPVGVITYDSPNACVIAPSMEAKKFGVKTGMRLGEARALCPQIIPVTTHPLWYRQVHIDVMEILHRYCDDVIVRSIDEAVVNFASYRLVYKDLAPIAKQIKADIAQKHDYLTCSIGIAPNTFLAKLGTELQKPNGLVLITPENIDAHLATLSLTDLPGIAGRNERRLKMIGINNPLQMRHTSPALLRKAFGGITGNYWHSRLNFGEVDLYSNANRTMSAMRTVSRQQRESRQSLESLLVSLCTRLEQRMVKQCVFCGEVSFFVRFINHSGWDTKVRLAQPVQDGLELRNYLLDKIHEFERERNIDTIFSNKVQSMGIAIQGFVSDSVLQYSLFDNRIMFDKLRKVMYNIKDKYGKNSVRKAVELFDLHVMKDAIGFGSVKDMVVEDGEVRNKYLLEEEY